MNNKTKKREGWRKETEKSAKWRKIAMKCVKYLETQVARGRFLTSDILSLWQLSHGGDRHFPSGALSPVLNKVDSSHKCVSEHFRESKIVVLFCFPQLGLNGIE